MNQFNGSLWSLIQSFLRHRTLIARMTKRDVVARYRGSMIGLAWSFVNPVLLLLVYTFVFSVVFKARWGEAQFVVVNDGGFAIMIFAGMIVHALFSECFIRSLGLITGNANFVKRVVLPLEVFSLVAIGSAAFNAAVSLLVLLGAYYVVSVGVAWLGFAWFQKTRRGFADVI